MPDRPGDAMDGSTRDPAARAEDHAGIERLSEALLPALIAKLASTRLGELEVREGGWRVRLRRPAQEGVNQGRRSTDRPSRSQPGHEGHGHPPGAVEVHARRASAGLLPVGPGRGDPASNGHGGHASHGDHGSHADDGSHAAADATAVATSPAVGVFVPGPSAASGTRVRAGDRLGVVDMLGVPQEVVAPGDGVVAATLVEAGTAVEYGQELVRIELATGTEAR